MNAIPRLTPCRIAINCCLSFCAVIIGTLILNYLVDVAWAPYNNVSHLFRNKDNYNIVFAGSSFVQNMLDPRVFDGQMKARGYETQSFNAGQGASGAHETSYLIRKYVDEEPARLAFVFVDFYVFEPTPNRAGTYREKRWHDLVETRSVVGTIRTYPDITEDDRSELERKHLASFLGRYTPIGKVFDLWSIYREKQRQPEPPSGGDIADFYEETAGYHCFAYIERFGDVRRERRRNQFVERQDGYDRELQRIKALMLDENEVSLAGLNYAAWESQIKYLRERRIEPVYLMPPTLWGNPLVPRSLLREGVINRGIFIDDPHAYPQFFEREARFDKHHIAEAMVPEYSRIVANRFADMLDADASLAAKLERVALSN